MLRQKPYYDSKIFLESFEPEDTVFVFFPFTKPGGCRQFRGIWQGTYEVKSKLFDSMCINNVWPDTTQHIAHIDNIKGHETRLDEPLDKESLDGEEEPEIDIEV